MIKKLDWDSHFFEKNFAHLEEQDKTIDFSKILSFANLNRINIIQSLVSSSNTSFIKQLESHHFFLKEGVIDFKKKILPALKAQEKGIRRANLKDFEKIKSYLGNLFSESRYKDIVSDNKIKDFYTLWLQKAILGTFDDHCFIYEHKKFPAGFITIKEDSLEGRIGLIAVAPNHQGKGIGKKLIEFTENYLSKENKKYLYVRTQLKNISAQNFYINNQFYIDSIKYWFYLENL